MIGLPEKIIEICQKIGFDDAFIESVKKSFSENHYNSQENYWNIPILDQFGQLFCTICILKKNDAVEFYLDFIDSHPLVKNIYPTHYTEEFTTLWIILDKELNFLDIRITDKFYLFPANNTGFYFYIGYFLDINLKVFAIDRRCTCMAEKKTLFSIKKEKDSIMDINDETLLIDFSAYTFNPEVVKIVPEFYIPSAYNFNSPDLQSRISLVKMLNI